MKLLAWMAAVVGGLVLLAVAVGYLLLPSTATVSREITIAAPQAEVFAVLNGFERFDQWSPWAGLDPDAIFTLSGPPAGVGARQTWRSDDPAVGSGSQEIILSEPPVRVQMKVEFAGFDAENISTFEISPEGQATRVTWRYQTDVGRQLLGRYFLLMLESMLAPQYEKGLVQLKAMLEQDGTDVP